MEKSFSKEDAVTFGWNAMKRNLGFFVLLILGVALLSFGLQRLVELLLPEGLEGLGRWTLYTLMSMVAVWVSLRVHDGRERDFRELFSSGTRIGNFLLTQFLYTLIIIGGLLLLIIPGIVWAVRFGLAGYVALDEGLAPVEALRRSTALTQGARFDLFLFGLIIVGINLLGALALGIGLFASIPTGMVACAWVYRKMQELSPVPAGGALSGGSGS